jgi:hypothetical protein
MSCAGFIRNLSFVIHVLSLLEAVLDLFHHALHFIDHSAHLLVLVGCLNISSALASQF